MLTTVPSTLMSGLSSISNSNLYPSATQQLGIGLLSQLGNNQFLATTALSLATSTALALSGGGSDEGTTLPEDNNDDTASSMMLQLSPRARASLWMSIAMALHFGGYEFARSSNLALFTSPITGFSQSYAFPLAMALVSPFSFLLLMAYNRELEDHGPQLALRHSTIWSIVAIGLSAVVFGGLDNYPTFLPFGMAKWLVGLSFVFSNSYAHLLYSQHWSFLGSVSTVEDGARWFASIAGLSSLASMCTGTLVSVFVQNGLSLYGLLGCTVVTLSASLLCAERAYKVSQDNGFDPYQEIKDAQAKKALRKEEVARQNLVTKARDLFDRVPTLQALFCEVLSFQSMSTILNVCMVTTLKQSIPNDVERAAWTGRFYAAVNGVSAAFQFLIMPLGMNKVRPQWAWRLMSIIPVVACLATSILFQLPSLFKNSLGGASVGGHHLMLVAVAFFATKCLDYSIRGVATEMVYVPLDFESRYVGKELNGVFGNRLGKSGMSVLLSALTALFGDNVALPLLTQMATVASLTWASCTMWLSQLVDIPPTVVIGDADVTISAKVSSSILPPEGEVNLVADELAEDQEKKKDD